MSRRTLEIDQALHGYADGHRLLRSSVRIPAEAARVALIMSDMSGPSMVPGFESYLTGYPLSTIQSYALARTWYAPEMERPGCVWTHTLIIRNIDLAQIEDLWVLTNLFVRPAPEPASWSPYEEPLDLLPIRLENENNLRSARLSSDLKAKIPETVTAIYLSPDSQVFLPTIRTSLDYEKLTIAIWSQQWPRLRRVFQFCTGAISNRKTTNAPFDIQVVPVSAIRELQRSAQPSHIVEGESVNNEWIDIVVNDLYEASDLRWFLRTYGAETSRGRADFISLVKLYLAFEDRLSQPQSIGKLIDLVVDLFPAKEEGHSVKSALFGLNDYDATKSDHDLRTSAILQSLAKTKRYKAFDSEALKIREQAMKLASSNFVQAAEIAQSIIKHKLSPIGKDILRGFGEAFLNDKGKVLSDSHFFNVLIEYEPRLATDSRFWRAQPSDHTMSQINDFLRDGSLNLEDLVPAMIDADSGPYTTGLGGEFCSRIPYLVLDWSESRSPSEVAALGRPWKKLLSASPKECVQWLKQQSSPSPGSVLLLVTTLNPLSPEVLAAGSEMWIRQAHLIKREVGTQKCGRAMIFFLTLGFQNVDGSSFRLFVDSFESVYNAALHDQITDKDWLLLRDFAPAISWENSWDKCERLRAAVLNAFIRFGWSQQAFLDCLQNVQLLSDVTYQALEEDGWFHKKSDYIKDVAENIANGKLSASAEQRNTLFKIFDIKISAKHLRRL